MEACAVSAEDTGVATAVTAAAVVAVVVAEGAAAAVDSWRSL